MTFSNYSDILTLLQRHGGTIPAHLKEKTAGELRDWRAANMPDAVAPTYYPAENEKWKLTNNELAIPIRGWFSDLVPRKFTNSVLLHVPTNRLWMSLSPLELESHALHIAAAHGKVLVAGLGMGMYLFNILRKPEVTEVHVLESDPSVILAFFQFAKPETWEGWEKVSIHCCDALAPSPVVTLIVRGSDYFYADIWPSIADCAAKDQTAEMCAIYKPKEAGYWCMEADLFYDMPRHEQEVENLAEVVGALHDTYGIPSPLLRVIPDEHIRLLLVQAVGYNLRMM